MLREQRFFFIVSTDETMHKRILSYDTNKTRKHYPGLLSHTGIH